VVVFTALAICGLTIPCGVMRTRDRLAAWLVTGPLGHLWSALADIVLLWTRYLMRRALKAARR
jgi:hypothetical protein